MDAEDAIFRWFEDPDLREILDRKYFRGVRSYYIDGFGGGIHWVVDIRGKQVCSAVKGYQPDEFYSVVDSNCSLYSLYAAYQYCFHKPVLRKGDYKGNYRKLGEMLVHLSESDLFFELVMEVKHSFPEWFVPGNLARAKKLFRKDVDSWIAFWVR